VRPSRAPIALWLTIVGSAACGLTGSFGAHDDADPSTSTGGASSGEDDGSTDLPLDSTGEETDSELAHDCEGARLRVATFNLYEVGTVGSDAYLAAVGILERIDADVVCLQEVLYWEGPALAALAADAGYDSVVQADQAPAIGGPLTNACIARMPLERVASHTASDLSPDTSANDVARDILVVRAHVHEACRVGLLNVHLKAGRNDEDRFRRQVEVERLLQATSRYREERGEEPVFALGDFNEPLDAAELGQVFSALPGELPPSYRLGTDIVLPLTYEPFARMLDVPFLVGHPVQAGTDRPYTWNDSSRLDYLFWSGAELVADEIYHSCRDEEGNGLEKAGAPLDCDVSLTASDHLPVIGDFILP
jgi:endonuclease/exonuclease/phosphatase family metal-dependent hydrolase